MAKTDICPVRKEDSERIKRILQVAFEDEYRRMGHKVTRIPTMTDRLLAYYMDRAPRYCFAAKRRGGLVGFCLACRWGSTAWMGPVAVLPPVQGKGIGKMLVGASTSELRGDGIATLGVETMPRSYRNLQFYSRLGMDFACLTLDMSRSFRTQKAAATSPGAAGGLEIRPLGMMSGEERRRAVEGIGRISGAVSPGLDYRPEVEATGRHGIGETFLAVWEGRPAGFAVVHTEPYAEEEIRGTVRVNTLLIGRPGDRDPDAGRLFEGMISLLESWLLGEGYDAVIVRVPARYAAVRDCLLGRGYSISHSDVRMTYADLAEADTAGSVHLSKWE